MAFIYREKITAIGTAAKTVFQCAKGKLRTNARFNRKKLPAEAIFPNKTLIEIKQFQEKLSWVMNENPKLDGNAPPQLDKLQVLKDRILGMGAAGDYVPASIELLEAIRFVNYALVELKECPDSFVGASGPASAVFAALRKLGRVAKYTPIADIVNNYEIFKFLKLELVRLYEMEATLYGGLAKSEQGKMNPEGAAHAFSLQGALFVHGVGHTKGWEAGGMSSALGSAAVVAFYNEFKTWSQIAISDKTPAIAENRKNAVAKLEDAYLSISLPITISPEAKAAFNDVKYAII